MEIIILDKATPKLTITKNGSRAKFSKDFDPIKKEKLIKIFLEIIEEIGPVEKSLRGVLLGKKTFLMKNERREIVFTKNIENEI